jgi:hypothetical protein
MLKTCSVIFLSALLFGQALAAEPVSKLSTQDLDSLRQKLEPTLNDPQLKDMIIHLRPGGNATKACIRRPDGSICCGSRAACEQQK